MIGTASQRGFTIVETMVVLAVTGALFLAAVVLVAGQQNKVAFQQAINDEQSVIQQTISEVSTGYYNNTGGFACDGTSGTVKLTNGSAGQGSNTGCILLGKAIEFGVQGTDPQQYAVFPIAGLQDNGGKLDQSDPQAVAPGVVHNTGLAGAITTGSLHNGLKAVSMQYNNGGGWQNIGAVAFLTGLGSYDSSTSELLSGAQQVSLVPVVGSDPSGNLQTGSKATADAIYNNLASSPVNPSGGVQICFASGGTNKSGLITIGSNGRALSVTLQIKDGKKC